MSSSPFAPDTSTKVFDELYRTGERSSISAIHAVQSSLPRTALGAISKATTANPKDLIGSNKVSLTKLPSIAVVHGAMAMMDGADKYGPYNWRAKAVTASIYVDAAIRHLQSWFEGQENASDSKVHHLGHVIGCAAILLDAQANGRLIDDRPILMDEDGPVDLDFMEKQLNALSEVIKRKKAEKAAQVNDPELRG